jgi:hypothetical protein
MQLASSFTRLLFPALLVVLLSPGQAGAQPVDRLIEQLESSSDYKVRLSAALSLSKIDDRRAIPAFIKALDDTDKTVRGVAAASLGKMIDGSTPKPLRDRAVAALKRTASQDKNAFVRKQAQKAHDTVANIGAAPAAGAAGGIYVNLGGMSAKTKDGAPMRALMRKTAVTAFKRRAPSMMIEWPGGKDPSKKQLDQRKMTAYHVDGTLNELVTAASGSTTLVSCKVSMLLATYPEKSMFGFLNGGAKVQAGTSDRDVQLAKEDCVAAVAEDLVAKVIQTIMTRTP